MLARSVTSSFVNDGWVSVEDEPALEALQRDHDVLKKQHADLQDQRLRELEELVQFRRGTVRALLARTRAFLTLSKTPAPM